MIRQTDNSYVQQIDISNDFYIDMEFEPYMLRKSFFLRRRGLPGRVFLLGFPPDFNIKLILSPEHLFEPAKNLLFADEEVILDENHKLAVRARATA